MWLSFTWTSSFCFTSRASIASYSFMWRTFWELWNLTVKDMCWTCYCPVYWPLKALFNTSTFTHSHTHSYTDGGGYYARCQLLIRSNFGFSILLKGYLLSYSHLWQFLRSYLSSQTNKGKKNNYFSNLTVVVTKTTIPQYIYASPCNYINILWHYTDGEIQTQTLLSLCMFTRTNSQ